MAEEITLAGVYVTEYGAGGPPQRNPCRGCPVQALLGRGFSSMNYDFLLNNLDCRSRVDIPGELLLPFAFT